MLTQRREFSNYYNETMAARVSGSKMVVAAAGAAVAMVGIGSIYLPFLADRDKIRGMHEEQDPRATAFLTAQQMKQEGILPTNNNEAAEDKKKAAPGSMWKQLSK